MRSPCPGVATAVSQVCRSIRHGDRGLAGVSHTGRVATILLIEDDALVRRGLQLALRRHGHAVRTADTGEEGLRELRADEPDLVVLDVMLPGIDGFEVCRRVRSVTQVPVIMLTARGDDFDVVEGLEAGADDYVVKPARPTVLDARIRAVLRRSSDPTDGVRMHRDLRIDTAALTVSRGGEPVLLTPTELRLLLTLSRTPGRVFSRQQLLEEVWEHRYLGDSRLVDNCVQRLRVKVEADPAAPEYVQTVRGFGYRFGPV
jgi:DNA-binding response OmpR family regulator